jgi:hypothetical protein
MTTTRFWKSALFLFAVAGFTAEASVSQVVGSPGKGKVSSGKVVKI